jgi:hypothetical protein
MPRDMGRGATKPPGPNGTVIFLYFFNHLDELVASEQCRHNIGDEMRIRAMANLARFNEMNLLFRDVESVSESALQQPESKDKVMEKKDTQPHMSNNAKKEHQLLHRLVGEWTYEGEAFMESGQPPEKFKGVESVRSIGGLWVLAEGKGETPDGQEAVMITTLGYDVQKQRYVGSWIGSMMTHFWVYDGEMDPSGKVLTLNCDGPDMAVEGKLARYRDVIEFKNGDARVLTAYVQGEDGKWRKLMTSTYRRRT